MFCLTFSARVASIFSGLIFFLRVSFITNRKEDNIGMAILNLTWNVCNIKTKILQRDNLSDAEKEKDVTSTSRVYNNVNFIDVMNHETKNRNLKEALKIETYVVNKHHLM